MGHASPTYYLASTDGSTVGVGEVTGSRETSQGKGARDSLTVLVEIVPREFSRLSEYPAMVKEVLMHHPNSWGQVELLFPSLWQRSTSSISQRDFPISTMAYTNKCIDNNIISDAPNTYDINT
jgi:hypothetical protein